MNRRDVERITDLLIEVAGRAPWVLLWTDDDDDAASSGIVSSVAAEHVPEMVCSHLLRLLRNELGAPDVIAVEH